MEVTCAAKRNLHVEENILLYVKNEQNFELTVKRNWMGFGRTLRMDYSNGSDYSKGLELNQNFMVGKEDFLRENRTREKKWLSESEWDTNL